MARRNIAVLDFGSKSISVMIGDRGVNNTFEVRGFADVNYAGFMNGEFISPEELSSCVGEAIVSAQSNARCKITHLFIGVPAEFSLVEVRNISREYARKRWIRDREVEELFSMADNFGSSATHLVVNRSPICFTLEDGRRLIDPRGVLTTKLSGTLCFALAERKFVGTVMQLVHQFKFAVVEFISENLSECLYLIEPTVRDRCAILVDCGYLTTSVSIVMGDGITHLKSFSLGGGQIEGALAEYFKIPFSVAVALKKQINLSIIPQEKDFYEVTAGSKVFTCDSKIANEIVSAKIRQIGSMIIKCLAISEYEYPEFVPIDVTGGGICYIKGAKDVLSQKTGKQINFISPSLPQMCQPNYSSILGLMDMALRVSKQNKIFRFFKKGY